LAVTFVTNLGSKSCVGITPHNWNPSGFASTLGSLYWTRITSVISHYLHTTELSCFILKIPSKRVLAKKLFRDNHSGYHTNMRYCRAELNCSLSINNTVLYINTSVLWKTSGKFFTEYSILVIYV
jgi:hypothetical protein